MITFSVLHYVVINLDIVSLERVANEYDVISQQDWYSGIQVWNYFVRLNYTLVTEEEFIIFYD